MTEFSGHDCEALLAQSGWVRALARHLTADAHAADDLAQDALTAALVHPAPGDRPLRRWLAGIVRNLARQERRTAAGRSARERAVARREAEPPDARLLERLESHRAVVEAVARLEEPYRTAILLRYFEGLAPAAIAARTATPLRTVHTRLSRALARLRADLDRAHGGDRQAWLLALLPFARGPHAPQASAAWPSATIGVLVMDAKLKIGLAALAVVGVCSTFALWPDDPGAPSGTLAAAPEEVAEESTDLGPPEPALVEAPVTTERRAVDGAAEVDAPAPAPAAAPPGRLSGRVIDVEHAPVAGITIRYVDPEHGPRDGLEATTDAGGAFELEDPRDAGRLDVASPGWTSVYRPELPEAGAWAGREIVLVVARSIVLGGIVVDEHGRGIASAGLAVPMPFGLRARFDAILDSSSTVERSTTTDADGRFQLTDVALVPGVNLVTTHAAFLADERAVPAYDELALAIVLRAVDEAPGRIVGQVVDPQGLPVEGAWVGLGALTTRSGPSGTFALDLAQAAGREALSVREADTLRAVKPGHLPAELAAPLDGAWPQPLILRLGGPPLAVAGRVVDSHGKPVPQAEIWTDEETHFGFIAIEGGEMGMSAGANIEGLLRGDPWTWRTRADRQGRFELAGLLPHDYRLFALDRKRMLATTARFPAGRREVEIRMPEEELHERIAGRVTSLSGAPLAGLEVVLERELAGVQVPEVQRLWSLAVTTDDEGLFEFEGVSRAVNRVSVQGSELGLQGIEHALGPGDDLEDLELTVPLRVHVQIDAGEQADFDRIAVLDQESERLELSIYHGRSAYGMQELRLHEGRTEPFSVSELATTLVLYRGNSEVRRVPLELVRGELNTIRP